MIQDAGQMGALLEEIIAQVITEQIPIISRLVVIKLLGRDILKPQKEEIPSASSLKYAEWQSGVDVDGLSQIIGFKKSTIRAWTAQGMPHMKMGRFVRYDPNAVKRWALENKDKTNGSHA